MATINSFEEIKSWQKAKDICKQLGALIDGGRFKNNYRFIAQIEGSTGSIMDNIAEGFERGTKGEFILFLGYAKGSCGELRSQIIRADRNYITEIEFENIKQELLNISGLIQNMISYLQKSDVAGSRKKV